MESFVDLTYRGLSLGRHVKLTQVRPSNGYLETPAPMPVGTTIAIACSDALELEAVVTAIHEQVGGSDRPPGMTVKPKLEGATAAWWKERVTLGEEEPPPPSRSRPVTVRPRSTTIVEPPKHVTAPMPTIAAPPDPALAAMAEASQTIAHAAAAPDDAGNRTTIMPAVDPATFDRVARTTSDEIPVARLSDVMAAASVPTSDQLPVISGAHEVVDDGKRTTMMDAVDLSALGLELPGSSGQMAAVKGDEDDDGPDESGPARTSQPNMPSSVKKRKRRNR